MPSFTWRSNSSHLQSSCTGPKGIPLDGASLPVKECGALTFPLTRTSITFMQMHCLPLFGEGEAMSKSRFKCDRDQHFVGKSTFCPR